MNKGSVEDLARRVDQLEREIDALQAKLKQAMGPEPPGWFYRARLFDSQNPAGAKRNPIVRK